MLILPTLCLAQETKIDPILLGLGEVFFFDKSLSHNKTQSCSTCHMPVAAFADLRQNDIAHMVSQGDDPTKFGNRNTPTALYAKYSPSFHFDEKINDYVGGQFWDGRAKKSCRTSRRSTIKPRRNGHER